MKFSRELNYHLWAEKKILSFVATIDESNWDQEIPLLKKSLKSIYTHTLEVMWFWFSLCKLKSLQKLGVPPNFASFSKEKFMKEYFLLILEMKDFGEERNEKLSLDLNWVKKPYEVTTHELIYHILNHQAYHRGQIAIVLKYFGIEVSEIGYNNYMFEEERLYE